MKDLIGLKFGKLLVLERSDDYIRPNDHKGRPRYKCLCECGKITYVIGSSLTCGITKSCGCNMGKNLLKHGFSHKEKLYNVWKNIKARCKNDKYYGGRGIKIYDEWKNDYTVFRNWAINNGYNENLTIDRIDVNGNYEPNNCRWVDNFIQANNKRNNVYLTYKNETKTVHQWEKIVGIKAATIKKRLRLGWSVERALTEKSYIGKNQYSKTPEQLAEMKSLWKTGEIK